METPAPLGIARGGRGLLFTQGPPRCRVCGPGRDPAAPVDGFTSSWVAPLLARLCPFPGSSPGGPPAYSSPMGGVETLCPVRGLPSFVDACGSLCVYGRNSPVGPVPQRGQTPLRPTLSLWGSIQWKRYWLA